jgi:hypothetical protein
MTDAAASPRSPLPADEAIDWRASVVTTLTEDWRSPWTGFVHEAGALVARTTVGRDRDGSPLQFITPSPEAVSLDLAYASAHRCKGLRDTVLIQDAPLHGHTPRSVRDDTLPMLYDYLAQAMVTVAFAYQALEAFANRVVGTATAETFEVDMREGRRTLTREEAQRWLSTDRKLAELLPGIHAVRSPKGRRPWKGFRELARLRDDLLHLKDHHADPRGKDQSVFHRLLADGVGHHPTSAVAMIAWFYSTGNEAAPRWLQSLMIREGLDSSRLKAGRPGAIAVK